MAGIAGGPCATSHLVNLSLPDIIYLVLAHQFDGVDVFRCPPGLHDLHQVP